MNCGTVHEAITGAPLREARYGELLVSMLNERERGSGLFADPYTKLTVYVAGESQEAHSRAKGEL